ncbi:MAG: diguanylate cyclase [Candidatus Glassbacteria bacterium]|nr:diguanylate cyclase [Candidatus Glassbacteria bacterium]
MQKDQYIVLVIDDDRAIVKLLSEFVSHKGYQVDTAMDGKEAIEKLSSHLYDLVIIDLNLPDLNGIEIVKWINQNSPETISIILSGHATIESTIEAISLGAFDYLVKPVQLAKLNIVLSNGLERRRMIRQNKKLISDLQIAKKNLEARVRQRTKELRKSQQRFRSLYDNAPDVYYTVNTGGMIIDCNKMACEFFGYPKSKFIGKHLLDLYTSDNFELIASMVPSVDGKGGVVRHQEVQVKRADGSVAYVEINTNLLFDEDGQVLGALTLQRNITARKRAEDALRESEERYRTIFRNAEVALWELDYRNLQQKIFELRESGVGNFKIYLKKHQDLVYELAGLVKIVDVNDAAVKMMAAGSKEELLGTAGTTLVPEVVPFLREYLVSLAEGEKVYESEAVLQTLKGDNIYGLVRFAVPSEGARFQNLLLSIVDITTRKEAEEEKDRLLEKLHELNKQLECLAITDGLTQLYNHRFFMESLNREFSRARRSSGTLACLMADIDNFKQFNDTYGHQKGDEILRKVASVLRKSRRGSDVVARYGGEEFMLLLPDTDLKQAVKLGDKLRKKVERTSIKSDKGKDLKVTVSLGAFAFENDNIKDHRELLRKVDQALYLAKGSGKNRLCTLGNKMSATA